LDKLLSRYELALEAEDFHNALIFINISCMFYIRMTNPTQILYAKAVLLHRMEMVEEAKNVFVEALIFAGKNEKSADAGEVLLISAYLAWCSYQQGEVELGEELVSKIHDTGFEGVQNEESLVSVKKILKICSEISEQLKKGD
jgi:hypothetical protein